MEVAAPELCLSHLSDSALNLFSETLHTLVAFFVTVATESNCVLNVDAIDEHMKAIVESLREQFMPLISKCTEGVMTYLHAHEAQNASTNTVDASVVENATSDNAASTSDWELALPREIVATVLTELQALHKKALKATVGIRSAELQQPEGSSGASPSFNILDRISQASAAEVSSFLLYELSMLSALMSTVADTQQSASEERSTLNVPNVSSERSTGNTPEHTVTDASNNDDARRESTAQIGRDLQTGSCLADRLVFLQTEHTRVCTILANTQEEFKKMNSDLLRATQDNTDYQEQLDGLEDKLVAAKEAMELAQVSEKTANDSFAELLQKHTALETVSASLASERDALDEEVKRLRSKVSQYESNKSERSKNMERLRLDVAGLSSNLETTEKDAAELRVLNTDLKAKISDLEEHLQQQTVASAEALTAAINEYQKQLNTTRQEAEIRFNGAAAECENVKQKLQSTEAEHASLCEQLIDATSSNAHLTDDNSQLRSRILELENKNTSPAEGTAPDTIEQLRAQLNVARTNCHKAAAEKAEFEVKYQKLKAKVKSFKTVGLDGVVDAAVKNLLDRVVIVAPPEQGKNK